MATATRIVDFVLRLRGNIEERAKGAADSVNRLGKAVKAAQSGPVSKLGSELGDLSKTLGGGIPLMGRFSGAVGSAGGAVQALAHPLGAVGLAVTGVTVGLGGLVSALVSSTRAAAEWIREAEEAGRTPPVTPEGLQAIRDADAALDSLGTAARDLGAIVAAEVAPATQLLADAGRGLVELSREVVVATRESGAWESSLTVLRVSLASLTFGASELGRWALFAAAGVGEAAREADEASESIERLGYELLGFAAPEAAEGLSEFARAQEKIRRETERREREARRAREERQRQAERHAREREALAAREAQALTQLQDAVALATATTPWEQLLVSQERELRSLEALARQAGETAEALELVAQMRALHADQRLEALGLKVDMSDFAPVDVSGMERAVKDAMLAGTADLINHFGGMLGGGLTTILSALGPHGAIAASVITILPELSGMLSGLTDEVTALLDDLPGILEDLLSEGIPTLIANLPALSMALINSLDDIFLAIVGSLDEILIALLYEMPKAMIVGLVDAIKSIFGGGKGIAGFFKGILEGFKGAKKGKTSETILRDIFGGAVPSFDTGGRVEATGLAVVDRGEVVVDEQALRRAASGASPAPAAPQIHAPQIHVHVGTLIGSDRAAIRQLTEAIRLELGPYGSGLTLAPRV